MISLLDTVLRDIERDVASHEPERGGAILGLPGRQVVTKFLLDESAQTTGSSYRPSPDLVTAVAEAEGREGLELMGIVHSHPAGVPHPSGQDERELEEDLKLNPHLGSFLLPIVTRWSEGELGTHELRLPSGRVGFFIGQASRRGRPKVRPTRVATIPLLQDLERLASLLGGGEAPRTFVTNVDGRSRLAGSLVAHGGLELLVLVPDDYPLSAPTVLVTRQPGSVEQVSLRWDLAASDGDRLVAALASHIDPPGPYRVAYGTGAWPALTSDSAVAARAGLEQRLSGRDPVTDRRTLRAALRSRAVSSDMGLAWARVLIVGCGSVGSYIAETLARTGMGRLTLVDPERVEAANLVKATYLVEDIDRPKVAALGRHLLRIDPSLDVVEVESSLEDIGATRLDELVGEADLVVAATDDLKAQRDLDRFAYARRRPAVFIGLYSGAEGGEVVFTDPPRTACYTCATQLRHTLPDPAPLGSMDYGTGRLSGDPRFATFEARDAHRDAVLAILETRFATRTTAEWLQTLRGKVPVAPVRSLEEALDPAELEGRGMLATYDHPTLGSVRSVGLPLRITDFSPTYEPGPALGQDQDHVLGAVGYGATEIAALRASGAFGAVKPVRRRSNPEADHPSALTAPAPNAPDPDN